MLHVCTLYKFISKYAYPWAAFYMSYSCMFMLKSFTHAYVIVYLYMTHVHDMHIHIQTYIHIQLSDCLIEALEPQVARIDYSVERVE